MCARLEAGGARAVAPSKQRATSMRAITNPPKEI